MFLYFEQNFIQKISLGKCFFQILAKIEMTGNKNRLVWHQFETLQHFILSYLRILFYLFINLSIYFSELSLETSLIYIFFCQPVVMCILTKEWYAYAS